MDAPSEQAFKETELIRRYRIRAAVALLYKFLFASEQRQIEELNRLFRLGPS